MNFKLYQKSLEKIAKKYHLRLIVLFGSQASQKISKESDIDLAILPSRTVNEEKLYEELMSLFKRADIDLVNIKKEHNHLLLFEILHKGIVLYEAKPGLKSTLEWQSFIDYVDFQRFFNERSHLLDKKIAALMEQ